MKHILTILAVMILASCSKNTLPNHNSMNSLDWKGTYSGLIQEGKTSTPSSLKLNDDLTYQFTVGNEQKKGAFVWSPNGQVVTLVGLDKPRHFFVGENYIVPASKKGKTLKNAKQLTKTDDLGIKEKYWKLVEIHGKPVKLTQDQQKEPYLILKAEGSRVTGYAGCNSFNGSYELKEDVLRIKFSQIATTMRACFEDNVETEFHQVLEATDNYSTDGVHLWLNKARMAPLAKFEAVYLH